MLLHIPVYWSRTNRFFIIQYNYLFVFKKFYFRFRNQNKHLNVKSRFFQSEHKFFNKWTVTVFFHFCILSIQLSFHTDAVFSYGLLGLVQNFIRFIEISCLNWSENIGSVACVSFRIYTCFLSGERYRVGLEASLSPQPRYVPPIQ